MQNTEAYLLGIKEGRAVYRRLEADGCLDVQHELTNARKVARMMNGDDDAKEYARGVVDFWKGQIARHSK